MYKNILEFLVYCCIFTLILSSINSDILPQGKEKTTNWPEPVFEHLTIADGLPENSVRCILQDHLGYLWFGTQNGLVRYDGYEMYVYQPDLDDSLSISYHQIMTLYEDKTGTLWIGTQKGLNSFNRITETFIRYIHNKDDSTSINSDLVYSINEDKNGNLFVGTDIGLNLFNKKTKAFRTIRIIPDEKNMPSLKDEVWAIIEDRVTEHLYVGIGNDIFIYDKTTEILKKINTNPEKLNEIGEIQSFYQAVDGIIWIGHSKGIARFNSLLNTIKYYPPNPSPQDTIENSIRQLVEDERGLIWGGGHYGNNNLGLICFDPEKEQFKMYRSDPNKQDSLSSNTIWSIYRDNSGIIWAGTHGAGLNKWDRKKQKFKRFDHDTNNPDGKLFNTVFTIIEDKKGIIWFGTRYGLHSFNRHLNEFRNYRFDTKINNNVLYIYIDEADIIWVTTGRRGLARFNKEKGSFHFYSNNPNDSMSISSNYSFHILPDDDDLLWIGTWGGGLNRFDKKSGKFKRYKHHPDNLQSLSDDMVECIYKDRKGDLWIGTNNGFNLFDRDDESFRPFATEKESSGTFIIIYEDYKGNFWLGTYRTGLHLFDRDKKIYIYHIDAKDGLAHNGIRSILEDNNGKLWLGTTNGLSLFDPETKRIRNYYTSDDFNENRYFNSAAFKTSTGEMLFGTSDGFIIFHPDSIKDDPVPPQVVISNVSLFNRPDEKLEYDGLISELKELNLSYQENDLKFDYVGLHYSDPSKNQYKYKLEGFDKDWINAGTQRNAVYTNLDAGEYTFRVKACNLDGVWNEEGASLKIIIPPPFWATWWAYGFYLVVLVSVLYGIRKYEMNRLNWKNQSKLDEVKLKEREETDRIKSRFFANISHEFRTPLTLILGPSENILNQSPNENITKQAGAIKRNANRLLGLINQLLDLSKLEAGKLELKTSKQNIVPFIKGITMSFESLAERKDITLKVKAEKEEIELYFDKEKMTKIMTNLLSNAFKFTPEGGQITVTAGHAELVSASPERHKIPNQVRNDKMLTISVKDTGIGISKEELPKLFDRFYQVDSSQTREHEGTGIGLALTKELIELHHGKISVDSKLGSGTEFTIELPIDRSHLKDGEIVEVETEKTVILNPDFAGMKNLNENNAADSSHFDKLSVTNNAGEDKYIVLVVEDNANVREFIKDSLGNDFQIEEASNGEQGVRKAEQIIPDLIISDIMMPKMDGNELTRTLKNDEKTSHIPIILLTAKSEQESKLEGLEKGADAYLTKPFDTKELLIRINNLINIRRKLHEKFSKIEFIPEKRVQEKKLTNLEEQFMCKVMEVIENHLSEEEFSIEQFGKEVGMSRVQLHRKLKALSGKSASNYLRSVRLNKAKKMIEEQIGNISEIAYSVGFSSPQYFTRCFKEEFGYTPSELSQ